MGYSDRIYVFSFSHYCDVRRSRFCGYDCATGGAWRRRTTSKARRRDAARTIRAAMAGE